MRPAYAGSDLGGVTVHIFERETEARRAFGLFRH